MFGNGSGYGVRFAGAGDAAVLAGHRAKMFFEMGLLSEVEAERLQTASVPWFAGVLRDRTFVGWVIECGGEAVAGAGMHLSSHGPVPGSLEGGLKGHIANVYTEVAHRRKGLAEALMRLMVAWARAEGLSEVSLSASEAAKGMYQRLGFVARGDSYRLKL